MFDSDIQEEDQWISISDMMSGLMVIFLFISISYMINIIKEKDAIQQIALTYNKTQKQLVDKLDSEFKDDFEKWGAKINRKKISIIFINSNNSKFNSPKVRFKKGKSQIEDDFKKTLNEFFPRFIKILLDSNYKKEILEIRIEGHTSSEWRKNLSEQIIYIKNMELSQDRTREVLKYVLSINDSLVINNNEWLRDKVTANGLSYSKVITNEDGKEDKIKSRRVEFRVKTKAEEKIFKIINQAK